VVRTILSIALLCLASSLARAGETCVYVSIAGEKKIAVYRADATRGRLTHASEVTLDGEPGALTTDPARRFLFASFRPEGKLASFRIEPRSGKLTPVSVVAAGADPAHLATDRAGRFLLAAYYVDGKVTVHAVGKDGSLADKPLQTVPTADKAHAVLPDPSNRFVFVPHTGPNAIFQFAFDPKTGRLRPNETERRLQRPANTGPRHIAFHPSRDVAYADDEQANSVTAYTLDTGAGTLKPLQTLSTLPKDFKGTNATAELKVHPSGLYLYCSNRGHDSIACFAIDPKGWRLTALGQEPTEKTPRSFDLDPAGRTLYAAGESSGKLACYRIDPATGLLTRFETLEVGKRPWWVMAVELPDR
jgi:6-phosphogluconolactonase